ncbi:MAG: DUF4405 domain-containing protein [Myxococcales bacterium]
MTGPLAARRLVNPALLAAGTVSVATGLLLQISFHMHRDISRVWGLDHRAWNLVHQAGSWALLALVVWHLSLNWKPLRALFDRPAAKTTFLLVLVFASATVTALAAWLSLHALEQHHAERMAIEIHDKLTLVLSILLVLHTWQRRRRLVIRGRPE